MGTCGGDIRIDRRLERLQRGEALLVAQLVVELHRKAPAIQITGKIQQMHFQVSAAVAGNGRPHADIGDTGPHLAIYLCADQVNPAERHATTLELYVGSRCTQLPGQLLPMQHSPTNAEWPPEQALGQRKVCRGQRIANLGAADPQPIELDSLGSLDAETMALAGRLQEAEITETVAAKAEIIAHFEVLHTQPVDQDGVDECFGAEFAQALVEGQAQDSIDTLGSQQGDLVAQPRQAGRSAFRGEILARLWFENHHATGHTQLYRSLTQSRQDCLVTSVNTVEVADGSNTAPVLGAKVVKASNQLHNALLAHKVVDYNHTRALTTGSSALPGRRFCETDA